MQSKPTTPLSRRKPLDGDPLPQLSPCPIRRSESLKLRPNGAGGGIWSRHSPNSPPSSSISNHGCCAGNSRRTGCVGGHNEKSQQPLRTMMENNNNTTPPPTRKARNNMTLKLTPARPLSSNHNRHECSPGPSTSHSHTNSTRRPSKPNSTHSQSPPKTPPVTPDSVLNDDMESEFSCSSAASCCWSTGGMSCDHNGFAARNGTTYSGRRNQYVVHCSTYAGQVGQEYLTPTQRAQRHIRRLKELLQQARLDVEQRDSEIMRLTREVVELRLFKASLDRQGSEEDKSNSSEAVTVKENNEGKTSADVSPIVGDGSEESQRHCRLLSTGHLTERLLLANSSLADSGHFDDMTTTTTSSSRAGAVTEEEEEEDVVVRRRDASVAEETRAQLVAMYEKRIAELMHEFEEKTTDTKKVNNDHVEALLGKLADGQTRYADLMMDHETAKEKIRELERKLDDLQVRLDKEVDEKNKMYLDKFSREHGDGDLEEPVAGPSHRVDSGSVTMTRGKRVSVAELMQQLQVTQDELENIKEAKAENDGAQGQTLLSAKEAISLWLVGARKTMYEKLVDQNRNAARVNKVDPEVTLQFLKSAIYYFLTDKENSQGHLEAIESILGFSDEERKKIEKAMNRKSF